jgi:predicted amidohydrolase
MAADDRVAIGLVQMTCQLGDRAANLDKMERLLGELAGRAAIACLPEMVDLGYNLGALGPSLFELAEPVPGPTTDRLAALAKKLNLAIVAGVAERDATVEDLLYDTVVLLSARGELIGRYRKTHLYPPEHAIFRAGSDLPVFELAGLRVGIAICFEHAFPQLAQTLARRGAQLVINASAVPEGFDYLQDLRTRARAQDNQLFVAAINHVGSEGGVAYCGGSQVADPRGDIVAKASDRLEQVILAEVTPTLIRDQRRQEPVFRCLRPELYRL